MMIYIENNSTNPYYNLALEEYCLKNLELNEDIVMLWRDDNAIIVGKHQNTIEEINSEFVKENNITVARRITGGGAVYHDLGNLNFTFIVGVDRLDNLDMKLFALPVIKALKKMGVTAELSGRNDITIDGRKISGTAQAIYKNKLLYHGTLLFNSNMDAIGKSLNVKIDKIESKGIKSVKSRVTNIKDYLKDDFSIEEFKKLLLSYLFEGQIFREYCLSEKDLGEIKKLEKDKFSSWDWVCGESPKCNLRNSRRFSGGLIDILLNISNGIIDNCKIYGDFLGVTDVGFIENLVKGKRYSLDDINEVLKDIEMGQYFGGISKDEVVSCFFK